jgi:hypothetical protein
MYTTINEELRIQACSIADLNPEQFAESLEDTESISVIYDPATDTLILNRDNKDYDLYEIAAVTYMSIDSKSRSQIMKKTGDLMAETNEFLDKVAKRRERLMRNLEADRQAKEWIRIFGEQPADMYFRCIDTLKAFRRIGIHTDCFQDYEIFMYGYIQGIRAERARRKKVAR